MLGDAPLVLVSFCHHQSMPCLGWEVSEAFVALFPLWQQPERDSWFVGGAIKELL